jgi:nucleoside 2-deoxyribosyltransferase
MGKLKTEKCFITDLPANNFELGLADYEYTIEFDGIIQKMFFNNGVQNWCNDKDFLSRKHIFAGALINGLLFDKGFPPPIIKIEFLFERLKEIVYPISPKDKLDNLFKTIVNRQNFDGQKLDFFKVISNPFFYFGHYFKSKMECNYYFKVLHEFGYINAVFNSESNDKFGGVLTSEVTFSGLNYFIDLTEKGNLSNKCFIAMSFNPLLNDTRQAIKQAIESTGFKPIIVDEVHYESEKTINDAIIANLKDCKFCIADFTEQRDGVYFESGFALGQGKPVIYTCREEDFKKSHFDTNHFPHIIYKNPEELKQKLIDKIKAWIV